MMQPLILEQKYGLPIRHARPVRADVFAESMNDDNIEDNGDCDEHEVSGLLSKKKQRALIAGLQMENGANMAEGLSSSHTSTSAVMTKPRRRSDNPTPSGSLRGKKESISSPPTPQSHSQVMALGSGNVIIVDISSGSTEETMSLLLQVMRGRRQRFVLEPHADMMVTLLLLCSILKNINIVDISILIVIL
jgi:hypothetical protein